MSNVERKLKSIDEALGEQIRLAEASGELRHLYGRPLDLSDDSPDWWWTRFLKREGLTHPLLMRHRELDEACSKAHAILDPLIRRRGRLHAAGLTSSAEHARSFNFQRQKVLEEYRDALIDLNTHIRHHNLAVPRILHRRHIPVEETVQEAARKIPPLSGAPATEARSWPRRIQHVARYLIDAVRL